MRGWSTTPIFKHTLLSDRYDERFGTLPSLCEIDTFVMAKANKRRGVRRNRRATYRVNRKIHFRVVDDAKRRLKLIKRRVKIGKTLPGSLMREVIDIFRRFHVEAPSTVTAIMIKKHDTWPGRVFVAQMENGEEFFDFSASGIRAKPKN